MGGEDSLTLYTQSNNRTNNTRGNTNYVINQNKTLGMTASDTTNNGSTLGSVALNDILASDRENQIETQSNHSNATYTSNTALTTAAASESANNSLSAMHIYQPSQVNNGYQSVNSTRTSSSNFNKKQGKRARSSKEKIYENEEEIKAAGLSKENEKREVRKLKNRIAAQKCREQKEVKIAQAEEKVKNLESERNALLRENDLVKRKLEHLQYRVKAHIIKRFDNDAVGKEDFPELYGQNGAQTVTDTPNYYTYSNMAAYNSAYQSGNPNLQISTVSYNYQQQQQQLVEQQQHQQQQVSYQNPISSFNSTLNSMTNSPQQQQQQAHQPSAIVNGYQVNPEPSQQIYQVYDNPSHNPSPGEINTPQENNNKSEQQQPNIIKRRNSTSNGKRKGAPISDLNLSEISNKKNSLSPTARNSSNNLPPPRRSPRIAKIQNLALQAPKTKDVIDLLDQVDASGTFNFSTNTSNNNSLLSAKLNTPKIEKVMKDIKGIEQSLKSKADPGLTPYFGSSFDGPMTRSAKKRKEQSVFFADFS